LALELDNYINLMRLVLERKVSWAVMVQLSRTAGVGRKVDPTETRACCTITAYITALAGRRYGNSKFKSVEGKKPLVGPEGNKIAVLKHIIDNAHTIVRPAIPEQAWAEQLQHLAPF
jgi:hypothetical protein